MSEKLKCTEADVIHTLKRDAVLAAALSLANSADRPDAKVYWPKRVKELRAAVRDYQSFGSSVDTGALPCVSGPCPSHDVCTRHAHCFAAEAMSAI